MPTDNESSPAHTEHIRLNVDIPLTVNAEINKFLPKGVKSEVVRCMMRMLLRDLKKRGYAVLDPLIEDVATIAVDTNLTPNSLQTSGVQNLDTDKRSPTGSDNE